MDFTIAVDKDTTPPRKRACINCGRRDLWGAGSRCGYDGHYVSYLGVWGDWCRHWCKDRRAPGDIGVYDEEGVLIESDKNV